MSVFLALRARRRQTNTEAVISILGLGAILIGVLATRIPMAVQPSDVLVSKVTPDDAYCYFQAAHNIVRGDGLSHEGLDDANGFHPLWLAMLLPLALFGRDTLVHGALPLGVALDVASVLVLWWALGGLTKNATIRLVAGAAYALNQLSRSGRFRRVRGRAGA